MVGEIKAKLLTQVLESHGWECRHVEETKATFATVKSHAARMQSGGDLTWQAAFPRSLVAFWDLLESLLFSKKYSASIHNGLRANRSAVDILESEELKAALTLIEEIRKKEQTEEATAAKTNTEQQLPVKADEDVQYDITTPAFVAATAACPTAKVDDLAQYVEKAQKIVKRSIQFIEPPTNGSLNQIIEQTTVGQIVGDISSPIGIVYDVKLSGEDSSKPAVRVAPLNEEHLKAMISNVMQSREDPTTIAEGDQYIFKDGSKHGHESTFVNIFRAGKLTMQRHKRTLTALYEYDSFVSRRERDRESSEMNLVEIITMISKVPLKLPIKDRVGFNGQNTCNGVGMIPSASVKDALKLTWAEKKQMMGSNIRRVGGAFAAEVSDADSSTRPNTRLERAFYHSMSDEWSHLLVFLWGV